jgi:Flp pilus assembly protein TadG
VEARLTVKRPRRSQHGAAAVEFALIAPIFILLVFGLIQYGWYFYAMQSGTSAVGEATRRMAVGDCQTPAEVQHFVRDRLGQATTATSDSAITVVTKTYTKADGTTGMAYPGEIGGTVTLSVTFPTFNLNLPIISAPNGGDVTRSATARIEDVSAMTGGC